MQTILIVHGQAVVRDTLRSMIEYFGFAVLKAASGLEARELLEQHGKHISGVLLDMATPGLDGEATFTALRRFQADFPMVLMSGGEEEDLPDSLERKNGFAFIHKPSPMEELLASLIFVLGPRTEVAAGGRGV